MSDVDDNGLGFILQRFCADTDGVISGHAVSSDGMHLASSPGPTADQNRTFAAIMSGLASLTEGASELFALGDVHRQIIESSDGWILIARISETAAMGAALDAEADLGLVSYEMALLATQLGDVMSPQLIERLRLHGAVAK